MTLIGYTMMCEQAGPKQLVRLLMRRTSGCARSKRAGQSNNPPCPHVIQP